MKINFFPYDFQSRISDGQVYVYLYGKYEDRRICVRYFYEPYFFVSVDNIDQKKLENQLAKTSVVRHELVEKELLGKNQPFWKVYTKYPRDIGPLAKELQDLGLQCYEIDILFVHRFVRDLGITGMAEVEAEGDWDNETFHATSLMQKEQTTNWKILAVDIETYSKSKEINPDKNPILMLAVYGEYNGDIFKKVLTWKLFDNDLDYLEIVKDETELLIRFKEILASYQPHILTGYYSDGFDLPYIKKRAEKLKVPLKIGLDETELYIPRSGRDVKIAGILHIDVFKFVRNIIGINLKTGSFKLDSVSEELLGHRKHEVDLDQLSPTWDNHPDKLQPYVEYNLHDSVLTYQLCSKLLPDMIEFTKIIGLPLFDVIRMRFSRLVENYIMKRSIEYNVLAPNRPGGSEMDQRMGEQIQGAFVYEPTPGLYEDIVVFDFRSLYPTIISAHNIGPEGFRCSCCENRVPGKEEYWFCTKKKSFLPTVLEDIILKRGEVKKQIKKSQNPTLLEAKSYALKILANSFYGYLGFFGARWYCLECAASTTAYARDYIKRTIDTAEGLGFSVIYADTDSCFLLLGSQNLDAATNFMGQVNKSLPGQMELEFEGYFPRGIFVAIKGKDRGAKKKYALIDESDKLKITGFEVVRRNWSNLAKNLQREILQLVLTGQIQEAFDLVKKKIKDLQSGKIPITELVMRTQITRELSQYSSVGPHVVVARRMLEKGTSVNPGTVVEYVIGRGSGLVRERAKLPDEVKEYDVEYYLNHQLLPAVNSIFSVLGYSEEELLGKAKQTGLGSFF